jgi:hypothetical protein
VIEEKMTIKCRRISRETNKKGETISPAAAEVSYPTPLEG